MEESNTNNIFKFATKELSQDAFICWLVNWINIENVQTEENNKIKKLARKFVKQVVDEAKGIDTKEMKKMIEGNYTVEIKRQYQKRNIEIVGEKKFSISIDILLIIKSKNQNTEKFAIIIEDKVNSSEHDNQIERYKKGLCELGKKEDIEEDIKGLKEKDIITCYYKPFDECGMDRKNVNVKYTRPEINKLLDGYNGENQYLRDYKEYINQIQECSKNYDNVEDKNNYSIIKNNVKDIKYFTFFKEIENSYKPIGEEFVYWGKATAGNGATLWCNIPINLKFKSEEIFDNYAFLKINSDKDLRIKLKIAKKCSDNTEGERVYRKTIYNNKELYDKIFESNLENTKRYRDEKDLKIERSRNGSTKTQPEMSIFTISNMDHLTFSELLELIDKMKEDLEKKTIELEFSEDYKDYKVKDIHKEKC